MTSEYPVRETKGRGLGDEIIYWRRPFLTRDGDPAENAGWITWADTLSGTKSQDYESRGWTKLRKYGKINSLQRERALERRIEEGEQLTPRQYSAEYIWGPILRHKDGPAEFPLEQILALRWYEKRNCPIKDVDPTRLFPQLRGHKVKHYPCPQCNRSFAEVDGSGAAKSFANHLRIMHEWDMVNILNYGNVVGIDFASVEYGTGGVIEMTFGDSEEPEGEVCEDCGETFFGKTAKARLTKHQKSVHAAFDFEAEDELEEAEVPA